MPMIFATLPACQGSVANDAVVTRACSELCCHPLAV